MYTGYVRKEIPYIRIENQNRSLRHRKNENVPKRSILRLAPLIMLLPETFPNGLNRIFPPKGALSLMLLWLFN